MVGWSVFVSCLLSLSSPTIGVRPQSFCFFAGGHCCTYPVTKVSSAGHDLYFVSQRLAPRLCTCAPLLAREASERREIISRPVQRKDDPPPPPCCGPVRHSPPSPSENNCPSVLTHERKTLHAAGAVEARSDPPNETTTSDGTPPPVARRQTGSSLRLSQQRERVGHVADGLVNGDWERGKHEEEEKEIEEGGAAGGGGKEHQVPSEYRALSQSPLLRGPVAEEEPAIRDTPYVSRLKSIAFGANTTEDYALEWKGAGGEFGMSADWPEAISMPDGEGHDGGGRTSLRGEACMTQDKQAEVRATLEKRRTATAKVRGRSILRRAKRHVDRSTDGERKTAREVVDCSPMPLHPPTCSFFLFGIGVALANEDDRGAGQRLLCFTSPRFQNH